MEQMESIATAYPLCHTCPSLYDHNVSRLLMAVFSRLVLHVKLTCIWYMVSYLRNIVS